MPWMVTFMLSFSDPGVMVALRLALGRQALMAEDEG